MRVTLTAEIQPAPRSLEREGEVPRRREVAGDAPTPALRGAVLRRRAEAELVAADVEREEYAASIRRLRHGIASGLVVWVLFGALDWLLATYVLPSEVLYLWGLRATGLVLGLVLLYRLGRQPLVTPRQLVTIDLACFSGIAVLISLMTLASGGLSSLYAQGIVTTLVVRSMVLQGHWRESALRLGAPALAYPLTVLASAPFSPSIAEQLREPSSLAAFGLNLGFIFVTYGFMVAAGHGVWALRMQVYATRSLGGYRLRHKLGTGGMGEVWAAEHLLLRREVAVKILRPGAVSDRAKAVARFEREVQATAELSHPNTVRVYDGGVTDDGLWYFAMERLEGEDLGALVTREGPLDADRAMRLVAQAARGLAEAHARGIVHRDVKPENLYITRTGSGELVKVLDFGIARLVGEDQVATLTQTGLLIGTPLYLSPEVAAGREADERADIYSLGCVLYFALTGSPPHDDRNAGALLFAHVHLDPMPPSSLVGLDQPEVVDALVMRCLAKDPGARFGSMSELAEALGALAEHSAGPARLEARRPTRPEARSA